MPLDDWFDAATEEEALFDLLYDELLTVHQLGSVDGAVQLAKLREGVSVDWGQINAAAAEWAENYAYDLVRELTATTRTQLQTALGAFFRTPGMTRGDMERLILQGTDGIPDLLDKRGRLISAAQRAEWIAVTETTRAYTAGEVATMEASGVDQVRPTQQPPAHVGCRCDISPFTRDDGIISWKWLTLNDGVVCGICAPMHGRDVGDIRKVDAGDNGPNKVRELTNDPSFYDSKTEKAMIFSEDGTLIAQREGSEIGIDLSGIQKNDTQGAHFVHNHPGMGLSNDTWTFTDLDIETAVDGNFSTMTAVGRHRTYTMTRPLEGWPSHEVTMAKVKRQLKLSDKYVDEFLHFRDGRAFGDSPETLNRIAKKFWRTYAEIIKAEYTEAKRRIK